MERGCTWHFGRFSFCESDNRLKSAHGVQSLSPKQAALLLFFLRNPLQVLTRREVTGHLWPSVYVGQTSLSVHMAALRKALGETGREPACIETIGTIGFRFLCSVRRTPGVLLEDKAEDWEFQKASSAASNIPPSFSDAPAFTRLSESPDECGTTDQVYRLYAQGRMFWSRRTSHDIEQAIRCFEQACALAPSFSLLYVGLADAYNYLAMHPGRGHAPGLTSRAAKQCAYRAIRLNPHFAPAWAALGHAQFSGDWEVNAAEDSYRMAIALDPGYAPAHQWYAWLLLALGRRRESEREILYAHQLNHAEPSAQVAFALHLHCLGQDDLALQQLHAVLHANPEFMPAMREIGRIFESQGSYPEAAEVYGKARLRVNPNLEMEAAFAHVLTRTGEPEQASQILGNLMQTSSAAPVPLYEIAVILVGLGRLQDAMRMLESAWKQRSIWPIWMLFDSRLKSLRPEHGFQALMQQFASLR